MKTEGNFTQFPFCVALRCPVARSFEAKPRKKLQNIKHGFYAETEKKCTFDYEKIFFNPNVISSTYVQNFFAVFTKKKVASL